MNFHRLEAAAGAGLPQLRGKALAAYLAVAATLAISASALTVWALIAPVESLAVLGLRTAKAVALIAVSAILVRRRRGDPVAALLSLTFLLWAITSSVDFTSKGNPLFVVLDRVRFLLFVLSLLLFPNGKWQPEWTRGMAVISAAVFLLGIAETARLSPTDAFLPLAIVCVVAAIASLIRRFAVAANPVERLQYKWVALGLVVGIGLILTARVGAALGVNGAAISRDSPLLWEALFQLGIIVLALGFLISLLRYRLFDAEAAITRSAAYAGLTLAVVATFAASEAVIEMWGQRYFGTGIGDVSAAIAAAIAAVLLTPLHDRISAWAEDRFQQNLVRLKSEMPQLLDHLSVSAQPGELGSAILDRVCAALHPTHAVLVFGGAVVASKGLDRRSVDLWLQFVGACSAPARSPGAALFLPLNCPFGSPLGWLALGPRPDGTKYGKDELAALQALLPLLSRSLSLNAALGAFRYEVRDLRRQFALSRSKALTIDKIQGR